MDGYFAILLVLLWMSAPLTTPNPIFFTPRQGVNPLSNPQTTMTVTITRCSPKYLWAFGAFCFKIDTGKNPAVLPASSAQTPPEDKPKNNSPKTFVEIPSAPPEPPVENSPEPVDSDEPVATSPSSNESGESSTVNSLAEEFSEVKNRPPRSLHFGPEFSVMLPSILPDISLSLPPFLRPAEQPPTVVVQIPRCCQTGCAGALALACV